MSISKPRRQGRLTEYQHGHYFLYITEWDAQEEGAGRKHREIEIYYARAEPIWHSTDPNKFEQAKEIFFNSPELFRKLTPAEILAGVLPERDVAKGV